MVDRNLFLYDLAITAIFKDEAPYLKEWLDYHLAAGVDHFYLYNNDSSDNYAEVLAPYIEANLVTLTEWPGKLMQYPAYEDAIENYRFDCRYMAFIDLDEFIFPKTNRSIVEVVDEILSHSPNAAGLAINWQCFGSNGQEKADYSRGVLERFTRRAPSDLESDIGGNLFKKTIDNPRLIRYRINPHYAWYFPGKYAVNSDSEYVMPWYGNKPILADKIVINHYIIKSKEEYEKKKLPRGPACMYVDNENFFNTLDHNEVFDDGILKYRAAREKNFSSESREERIQRVEETLVATLTQHSLSSAPSEFFVDKIETFLTCRAAAEKLGTKIGEYSAEEIVLAWIYTTFVRTNSMKIAEVEMFMRALPEILIRSNVSFRRELKDFAQDNLLPSLCESLKNGKVMEGTPDWMTRAGWLYIQKLFSLIK